APARVRAPRGPGRPTRGGGGGVLPPRLPGALGLPFVDGLTPADMSQDAARREGRAGRSQEGLCEGEQETTPAGRFLSYFARAASVGVVMTPDAVLDDDDTLRQRTEDGVRELAGGAPGVLLGRAGAVLQG